MVQKITRRWRQKKESWIDPRRIVDWFRQAGPGAAIFPIRPFLGTSSFFPTKTGGLGVLLELAGVEVDGAARTDLDFVANACGAAVRSMPDRCVVYRYDVVRERPPEEAPLHEDETIAVQQVERWHFLEEIGGFKQVRLFVALYLKSPSHQGMKPHERNQAKERQRRELESAVLLLQEILGSVVPVHLCSQSETTAFYSYLETLEEEMVRTKPLKTDDFARYLGNAKVRFDKEADCLRVGHRYVQPFSLLKRPEGTMPALWRDVFKIKGVEFVLCHIYREKTAGEMKRALMAREQAANFGAVQMGAAVLNALSSTPPDATPVKNAAAVATEQNVKKIGKVMALVGDGRHGYGDYSLFGLVHSRSLEAVRTAMPRFHRAFRVPGDV